MLAASQQRTTWVRRWRGKVLRTLVALVALAGSAFPENAAITFDIPAQSLATAIERFSETTGQDLIYNSNLTSGRRSHEVRGQFQMEVALAVLLQNTGLFAERTGNGSLMLRLASLKPEPHMSAAISDFYARIQLGLRAALCGNTEARPGRYRIVMRLWIDRTGRLRHHELIGSGGSRLIDSAIQRAISRLDVGVSPPADLEQPVVIVIQPQTGRVTMGCDDAAALSTQTAP